MDASSLTCSRERTVHDAPHAALRVADVLFASSLARLSGVRRTGEVRPFSTYQRGPLLGFGVLGRNRALPRLPQLRSGFVGPFVFTGNCKNIGVPFSHMFILRQALKIFQTVIGFVSVNVVDLFGRIKTVHPTFRYNAVDKMLAAQAKVTLVMLRRCVWAMLSENFPAARDGVKVINGPVFRAIDRKANHAVSSVVANMITLSAFRREVKRV
jgi:hypothetical protein